MNSPVLFANNSQNCCLAFDVVLLTLNCKAIDQNIILSPVANLQSTLLLLTLHRYFF